MADLLEKQLCTPKKVNGDSSCLLQTEDILTDLNEKDVFHLNAVQKLMVRYIRTFWFA